MLMLELEDDFVIEIELEDWLDWDDSEEDDRDEVDDFVIETDKDEEEDDSV